MNRKGLEVRKRKGEKIAKFYKNRESSFCIETNEYWDNPRHIARAGQTPCDCSCWMCGNRRRNEKGKNRLTLKEQLSLLYLEKESFEETE